jgi:putative ABC transport system permease protein
MVTAASLSYKNLLTKRGRTLITSFAGSIGIIGVALVLALSSGLSAYMETMQSDTLAGFPITITRTTQTLQVEPRDGNGNLLGAGDDEGKFPNDNLIYNYDSQVSTRQHTNNLTADYLDYISALPDSVEDAVNNISYTRGVGMNVLAKGSETVVQYSSAVRNDDSFQSQAGAMMGGGSDAYWQEMPDNHEYILSLYDLIGEGSRMPENKNEILLVVNEYNQIEKSFFEKLGITSGENYQMNDFIGKQLLTVVPNDEYYIRDGELFTSATGSDYEKLFDGENGVHLTVSGILRIKEDAATNYFSEGFVYTPELTNHIVLSAQQSEIALAQIDSDKNVITDVPFADNAAKEQQLLLFGADTTPTGISIYPKNFESKEQIKEYLDVYNVNKPDEEQIIYTDMAEMITSVTGTLLDTVSYVLIGFAAISLLVSTIMIAIITYVSVIERTKEIGVLRAVGARKKDISRVFNAETMIIGLTAGMFGVGLTYLLSIPINIVIERLVGISSLALLNPGHAIILILGSIALTLIAGFIPSRMAAEKDPVEALRTE